MNFGFKFTILFAFFIISEINATVVNHEKVKITPNNRNPGDHFGYSLSLSGNNLLVGAPGLNNNRGAAYLFSRSTSSTWTQVSKIIASARKRNDAFGNAVYVSANVALVGAYGQNNNKGAAYIFTHSQEDNSWVEQCKLTASDGGTNDYFGNAVCLSGNLALIGAYKKASRKGAVYVFVNSGGQIWQQQAILTASDSGYDQRFGKSVSISGNMALIGACRDGEKGFRSGAAYIFDHTGGQNWSQQAKIQPMDAKEYHYFALGASLSGNQALIGAYGDDLKTGAAYIFANTTGNTWVQQTKLNASDGEVGDHFGYSVAMDKEHIAIGGWSDQDNGSRSGSAYHFKKSTHATWTEQTKILSSDGKPNDEFSTGISIDDGLIAIGSYKHDNDKGAAYLYQSYDSSSENLIVTSKFPPHLTENVASSTNLNLHFNQNLDSTIEGNIHLINVNGKHLVSASVNSSSNCIVITPQNHLKQGSNFYVHIDSGAIKSELGQWFEGFTSDGDWSFKTQPQKPINLLAGGFKFLLNIQDKKVFSMGRDERDQLGRNGKNDTLLKVTIEGDPDIIDIDCGAQHSIARTASGNMVIWGGDDFGQSLENLQVVDQLGKIIDISCGAYSSYALNDLGQLWARGRNHLGQLGIKGKNIKRQWTQVTSSPSTEKMIKVSSGIEHLLILCASGNLYGTGSNGFGQLGLKGKSKTNTIHLLDSNSQFIDVEAGGFHSLALTKNGNVCAFGRNDQGQLGLGYASEPVNEIGHLLNIGNVTKLSGGYLHSIFFQKQASGNLCYGSGSNRNQQLSNGSVKKIYRPKLIASGVHDVSTGSHCSIFLYENNHLEKRGEWK